MTINEMKEKNGHFELDGKEYVLTQQPYLENDRYGEACFEALAICTQDAEDELGYRTAYRVTWEYIDADNNDCTDYSDCADWDNPEEVRECGEYNIELNVFC